MRCLLFYVCVALAYLVVPPSQVIWGQVATRAADPASLFEAEDELSVTLNTDLRALLRDRGDEPDEHPAVLSYTAADGSSVTMPLKVRVRGNFRRQAGNCAFPPIRLNFAKQTSAGTLFEGQDRLKLVTHCQSRAAYEQFVLLEYAIYRVYNELTDLSFRVRLVRMTYEDASGRRKPLTRYGFLIEDEDAMAARNKGTIVDQEGLHQESTDPHHITMLSLFQYLIGNTDWSVPALHNINLVKISGLQMPFAVPYDFDFSGLISTPYATPAPGLHIETVYDRLYRGFCRTEEELMPHIVLFQEKKDAIYAIFNQLAPLKRRYRWQAIDYLDSFYSTIDSPRRVDRAFIQSCRRLN